MPGLPTTRRARDRDRSNRRGLERQLALARDPSRPASARKRASRYAAALAEKLGILDRPPICDWCRRRLPLQRHHPDHALPLAVLYLCGGCHAIADGPGF